MPKESETALMVYPFKKNFPPTKKLKSFLQMKRKIIHLDKGTTQQKVIRNSLKNLEDQLSKYPGIYRCHRTCLVNLQKVIHASGNAQGIKLHLNGTNELIPVSRSLTQEIKQKIAVR